MEPKALPPAKINSSKLLGASKSNIIAKKISVKSFDAKDSKSNQDILIIKKQVIKIKDLIATNTLLKAKEEERKRKESEQKRFAKKEEKLEAKKEPGQDKLKLPATPKLGFLERIKKFLFSIILGKIAIALLPNLPKLSGVFSAAFSIQNTIIDYGGKILDGLMTFVDKGYEAYDQSGKLIKNFGGDPLLKLFEGLTGSMSKMIDAAIIAAIAFSELRGDSGKPDITKPGRGVFGKGLGRAATRLGIKTIGKDATKNALRLIRPLVKRAPLIGGLLEFGISWALGDPLPKAAFRGVGSILLGAIGTAIGGPIGLAIGGYAGGELAGVLYDMFFNNKTPTSTKVQGRAQGGSVTRSGKLQAAPKRTVQKTTKREISVPPTPIRPGSAVGGEKNITKIFPKKDPKINDTVNPLGYIEGVYKDTSKINYFGPLFGLVIKKLAGDEISKVDYKNVGISLNSWMSNTFGLSMMGGFAQGGEVSAQMFMGDEDLTNVIAKSVEESVSSKLDKVIDDLERQLMLKPREVEKKEITEPSPGEDLGDATEIVGGARLLMAAGFPSLSAAVLASVIQAESSWRGQRTPWVLNDGAGTNKGLISWNRSRIVNAEKFLNKPLETASNAEQIKWIKEELKQYGLLDDLMNPQATEEQLKEAVYRYVRWDRRYDADHWANISKVKTALERGEQGSYIAGTMTTLGSMSGNLSSAKQIASSLGLQVTSYVRPGDPGYHGKGRAMDFQTVGAPGNTGTPSQMQFAQAMISRYGSNLKELIYTPLGYGIKNGKQVSLATWGDKTNSEHYNHVHVAFAKGGKVHGFTRAILGEKGPEFVIDADSTRALEDNYPGFLNALNKSDYSGALSVLRNYASYESGAATQVIIDKEIVPILFPMPTAAPSGPIMTGQNVGEDYMAYGYQHG